MATAQNRTPVQAYEGKGGKLYSILDGMLYRPPPRPKPYVWGMEAFGDSLYQRPFVKQLDSPLVRTLWPQVYADIRGVRFVEGGRLRTSVHNGAIAKAQGFQFERFNAGLDWQHIGYSDPECITDGICGTFRKQFASRLQVYDEPVYDLPPLPPPKDVGQGSRKLAVIRPVTIRKEWQAEARAPDAKYIAEAADVLRERGYFVLSVAFLAQGEEWLVRPAPNADVSLHGGELTMWEIASLVQAASVCVGGVGFIIPLCASTHTPVYTVLGGFGGINSPASVIDPAMDQALFGWGVPDNYCRCTDKQHTGCDKTISSFSKQFTQWLDGKNL